MTKILGFYGRALNSQKVYTNYTGTLQISTSNNFANTDPIKKKQKNKLVSCIWHIFSPHSTHLPTKLHIFSPHSKRSPYSTECVFNIWK